jgi:hypothetical protein
VKVYGEVFAQFARFVGKDPDQLVSLSKPEIEELIHSYLDSLMGRNLSKKTIKTWRAFTLMHFVRNGFKGAKGAGDRSLHSTSKIQEASRVHPKF